MAVKANHCQPGRCGIRVYAALVVAGSVAVSALLHHMNLAVGDRGSGALIITAMWIPALARTLVTRTVNRGWRSPFSLRRWGRPHWAVYPRAARDGSCNLRRFVHARRAGECPATARAVARCIAAHQRGHKPSSARNVRRIGRTRRGTRLAWILTAALGLA